MEQYIQEIVLALVGLLTTVILAALGEARTHFLRWLKTRRILSEREYLRKAAEEGFSLIEQSMKDCVSTEKLNAATAYVTRHLKTVGIEMEPEAIRAAVEQAVTEYNKQKK